jgi:deoxycytidylate deaminase
MNTLKSDLSEIVIAFVGAVGVDLSLVEKTTESQLLQFGYQVESVRITTDVIPLLDSEVGKLSSNCAYDRIKGMMEAGTKARKSRTDILALGVAKCINERRNASPDRKKTAYLVHSLKHPDEVIKLRELYPRGFYLFGVYAPGEVRRDHLIYNRVMSPEKADELMKKDAKEDLPHGQQVVDTFHLSDFFVGWAENDKRIREAVIRFVDIIFGDPFRTPTFGEYAMFLAFASSLRSADLSRQVGAVIARDGEILSLGANDCPKFGGGLYWPEYDQVSKGIADAENGRDWKRGIDSNRKEQLDLVDGILAKCGESIPQQHHEALRTALLKSGIKDLTEYGRVVHAEMEALLSCGRKGISPIGATLYCTTFPCHNCAKHIVASGIDRVVFVEPYMKSKAKPLHDDSICLSYPGANKEDPSKKVRFEPFFGVGPRRFFDLFSMSIGVGVKMERKDRESGKKISWSRESATPRLKMMNQSYLEMEREASGDFQQSMGQKC